MRLLPAALLVFLLGCPKQAPGIGGEDELIGKEEGLKATATPEELAKINCADASAELEKARNDARPETDRVMTYIELYESLKKRSAIFEDAMTRNPDLLYQDNSRQLVTARDTCRNQEAEVRQEFERFVRELVETPTMRDMSGGRTVTVARLDFNTLRQAIDSLSPDDKETMLNRLASAEKNLQDAPEPGGRRKR